LLAAVYLVVLPPPRREPARMGEPAPAL
jgi:hypothetical protein